MLADYHTHTYLCKHASGEPEEYLRQAERAGLAEIGVSDHCPWPDGYDTECRMAVEEYGLYRDITAKLQSLGSKVKVRIGLEVDWVPGQMEIVREKVESGNFDYIIGSVHYVDDFPFDNPAMLEEWAKPGKQEWVWANYASLLTEYIMNFDFEIIGHMDLPKKFGHFPCEMKKFMEKADYAFELAGAKNMSIELNTSGLRKPVKEIYPSLEILKLAKFRGLTITLGSDAHHPSEVAANFKDAVELATLAGYKEFALYSAREASLASLF
ncbi:MAG: hypothetical protein A2020_04415 [Lentisphaerae bacterium GWF2_45_14]|nr:MAG: hypothetical protein A2020_04415 [Lentisphaerae bacterium GWF2_45_14]